MAKTDRGIFVSASSLKDYMKCSQMAYYRIFEPELKVPNREMIIGDIVHKVIEKAWQSIDVALNLGVTLATQSNLTAVDKQAIEHYIHVFFDYFSPLVTKEDKVEKFFKIKLPVTEIDVFLVGKFDRISRNLIFDWKTGSKVPRTISNDPQFIVYNLAYQLLYKQQPESIYFASLNTGGMVRYTESQEHTDTLISYIIPRYIDDVRKKNFIKHGLFNGACYRCPFKTPCLGEKSGVLVSEFSIEE